MKKMADTASSQYEVGAWSTSDARHSIAHEIGHALENQYLTDAKRIELEKLRREEVLSITGSANTDILSEAKAESDDAYKWARKAKGRLSFYGFSSVSEMIAESVAQNLLSEPGIIAQQVIFVLMG